MHEDTELALRDVAWSRVQVVRGVCSAMAGRGKRRAPLCAALINTLLMPQLFLLPQDCSWLADEELVQVSVKM